MSTAMAPRGDHSVGVDIFVDGGPPIQGITNLLANTAPRVTFLGMDVYTPSSLPVRSVSGSKLTVLGSPFAGWKPSVRLSGI